MYILYIMALQLDVLGSNVSYTYTYMYPRFVVWVTRNWEAGLGSA